MKCYWFVGWTSNSPHNTERTSNSRTLRNGQAIPRTLRNGQAIPRTLWNGQAIPRILRNLKIHYRLYQRPPLVPILRRFNPLHTLITFLFHFNFPQHNSKVKLNTDLSILSQGLRKVCICACTSRTCVRNPTLTLCSTHKMSWLR